MMKALDKSHPRHRATAADPFWVTLFERLDRVVKLQLAICPDSDVHRQESMVSSHFESLKRMYEHLSHGVSFDPTEQIAQRQLYSALQAWLAAGKPEYNFDATRVTNSGLQEWKPNYIISVSGKYPDSVISGIRKFRDDVHLQTTELFDGELRNVDQKDFKYWLERERKAGGRAIIQSRQLYEQRMQDIAVGKVSFSFENIYSSQGLDHFNLIVEVLREKGTADKDIVPRLKTFLDSNEFKDYPASRIAALVWAAAGRAAASGQKEPPNRGTGNDIKVLTLLPFCDAMFVDNGCRALWEKIPGRYRPSYKARLFSYNTREQFLVYLDQIEKNADLTSHCGLASKPCGLHATLPVGIEQLGDVSDHQFNQDTDVNKQRFAFGPAGVYERRTSASRLGRDLRGSGLEQCRHAQSLLCGSSPV
jgi:hypothetical protein